MRLPLCCRHWVLAFDYARRSGRSRGERASKRTAAPGNTMEWNGTERNGRSVTKYQLSPYQRVTALHRLTRVQLRDVLYFFLSPSSSTFVVIEDITSPRALWQYLRSFLCVRSIDTSLLIVIVLSVGLSSTIFFYSWRSMIILDIIIVIWSRTFVLVGILMVMQRDK